MSVFKGHDDLSLNRYYYSFYSFSQDDPNTIKSFVYDQNQTLVSSKDISFNSRNISDMLSFLENSQSNPYALGKSNDEFLNMDITFAGLYKKALTEKQQQSLMTSINKTYKNVYYGTVNTFTIQVTQSAQDPSKPVFIFNGDTSVENPMVPVGTVGLYIFDQSHPSNAGFPIAFRNMQSPFTPYTNVIVEGTPGTPNSYSLVSITDVSAPLHIEYYTTSTETNAEFIFGELLNYLYQVKVETNIVGDPVFAIQSPGQSAYVLQPDLSFNIGDLEYFYVGDDSMDSYNLVFGPTVDDTANVVGSPHYVKKGDIILLDLTSGYTGDPLVYFEDSSAGMGYVPGSSITIDTSTDIDVTFNTANASASNYGGSFTPDLAFNNNYTQGDSWITYWESPNRYDTGYNYPGPNNTIVDNVTISGEWLQMDFGSEKYIGKFTLSTYNDWDDVNTGFMTEFVIAGSSDGSNFTEIGTYNQSNILKSSTSYTSSEITSTNVIASRYIRLIGVKVKINMAIREWQMKEHPLSEGPIYTVAVSSNSFWIQRPEDSGLVEKPAITFNDGTTYIFDQSDSTNENNTLVIGTAPDVSSSIVSSGLTIMGTPGQPGAYTHYVSDGSPVYYFSYQTENMGEEPLTYTVKVVDHEITGEKIFSIQAPGTSTFINQPDLSFGAGDKYQFNVADDTMTDISLVFGTTVDDISTRNESVVSRYEGTILLDIGAGYDGDRLVYFEDSSAGMGYVSSSGSASGTAPQLLNSSFESNGGTTSDGYNLLSASSISNWYSDNLSSTHNRTLIYDNSTSDYIDTPFGTYFLVLHTDGNPPQYSGDIHQIIDISSNNYTLSWYDCVRLGYANDMVPLRIEIIKTNDNTVVHTHEYISNISSAWTERSTSFTITENSQYKVRIRSYINNSNESGAVGIDNVTFSIAQPPVENYTVDVANSAFRLNSGSGFDEKPAVDFANNSGTVYIFDQSDSTNANNTLVIGTTFDDPASIVSSRLTIMGTPGQPGAYTKYVSDGSTVYYFSYQTENMGLAPPNITDDLYVHYDFELPLYDPNGTAYSTDVTGGGYERIYNKAYDSITNSDISYNAYVAAYGGGVFLNSTIYKIGSSSAFVNGSSIRNGTYTFLLNSTQGYSVAFWMKEDTVKGPLFGLSNGAGANTAFFYIEYNNTTDFIVYNNGKTFTSNISALTMTNWNHIVFTMSSDGYTWNLYINSTLVNTKTDGNYLTSVGPVSGYPTDSVFIMDIGGKAGNTSYIGYIDDFRFYKTELSQAQVSAVYSYTG